MKETSFDDVIDEAANASTVYWQKRVKKAGLRLSKDGKPLTLDQKASLIWGKIRGYTDREDGAEKAEEFLEKFYKAIFTHGTIVEQATMKNLFLKILTEAQAVGPWSEELRLMCLLLVLWAEHHGWAPAEIWVTEDHDFNR